MKVVASLLHSGFILTFLFIADKTRNWSGAYTVIQLLFIAILCVFILNSKRMLNIERLLLKYSVSLNLSLSLLTIPCIWGNKDWYDPIVYWYTVFMGLIFVIVLAYGWIRYSDELGVD